MTNGNGSRSNGNGNGNGRSHKPTAKSMAWKERTTFENDHRGNGRNALATLEKQENTIPTSGYCLKSRLVAGAHWWVIEMPRGPISHGECKYCHASRVFRNRLDVGDDLTVLLLELD